MIDLLRHLAYNVLPHFATVFITVTYLPQIYKTWKKKSVEDMSIWFWILLNLFLICMWTNSVFAWIDSGNFGYFMTESVNFGLALVVFAQMIIYRKK
jgi:uncharacterized protein with PQ loop repeat